MVRAVSRWLRAFSAPPLHKSRVNETECAMPCVFSLQNSFDARCIKGPHDAKRVGEVTRVRCFGRCFTTARPKCCVLVQTGTQRLQDAWDATPAGSAHPTTQDAT